TDGTGRPASYDVRYAVGTLTWSDASNVARGSCATPVAGTVIGAKRSCTVLGLAAATAYQVQLVAFRGTLNVNAVFGGLSNIASGTTMAASDPPAPPAVVAVSVSPTSVSVTVGGSLQLTTTLKDTLVGLTLTATTAGGAGGSEAAIV